MGLSAAEHNKVLFHGTMSLGCHPKIYGVENCPRERLFFRNSHKGWPGPCSRSWVSLAFLYSSPWVWASRSESPELVILLCSHPSNCHGVRVASVKYEDAPFNLHMDSITHWIRTNILTLYVKTLHQSSLGYLIASPLTYISVFAFVVLYHGKWNIGLSVGRPLGV